MDGLRAWLALARTPGLNAADLNFLLETFGDPEALLAASARALSGAGLRPAAVHWLTAPDHGLLDCDEAWVADRGHSFIRFGSPSYPSLLAQIPDAPVGLFVRGDAGMLLLPQLAMVGARNPTHAGTETAYAFAIHLATRGITITSGLAVGIDAASHRGALKSGVAATIAVCGTGPDIVYPAAHAALAEEISAVGALVTEFPCGTPPMKQNFPRRNRLISGLSLGTLVVEAALRSGSLITARLAAGQGRDVFAIPGSIHNPLARGCHELIRQGATLVESALDIFPEIGREAGLQSARTRLSELREHADSIRVSGSVLDKDRKILLDALGFEPAGVDLLVRRTGFAASEVASMLLILELDGYIESFPGGCYVRAHP